MKPRLVTNCCLAVLAGILIAPSARAATIQWINSAGGNWSIATNWSPAQVPGPVDTAAITASGTYTVTLNVDASVAGLTIGGANGTQTFALSANTLTLNGDCVVNANGQFRLSGGDLSGTNTLSGLIEWAVGGIGANAVVTVATNAVLTMSGSAWHTLDGILRNAGRAVWSGAAGSLWLGADGAKVENLAGAVWEEQTDGGMGANSPTGCYFSNAGLWRKVGGTGTSEFYRVAFQNSGSVEVLGGVLRFSAGGAGLGTFHVATNAQVVFGDTYTGGVGTALNGPGWYAFEGGVTTLEGQIGVARLRVGSGVGSGSLQSSLTVGNEMSLSGGTWLGTNGVLGAMNWVGGTIGDNALVTVATNAVLTMSGGAWHVLLGTLRNAGRAVWSGAAGSLWLGADGAKVENLAGAIWEEQTDGGMGANSSGYFSNEGLWRKIGGTNTSEFYRVAVQNSGTMEVQRGSLALNGGIEITASSTLSFGLRSATNHGQITLPGSISFTGRLCATLLDGFVPANNDVFEVMTFASRTGDFTDTSCLDFGNGIRLRPEFTATTLRLVMTNSTPTAGVLQFTQTQWSVAEYAGTATITATRTGGSVGAVSVSFSAIGGTANSGSDFTLAPGTLQWADGEMGNKTFTVTILNDALPEGNETVNLSLSNPTGGPSLGSLSNATLTILDDESAIASTFDSGAEGWLVVDLPATNAGPFTNIIGTPLTPFYSATGGNPGGYIFALDPSGNAFYFQAPARYLGNQSAAYGANLTYDQRVVSTNNTLREIPDVILVGGSTALVYQASANPGSNWTSFSVLLLEGAGWRIGSLSGPIPTKAEFQAVLASLTALRIRGEYSPTPLEEITALDNVTLNLSPQTCVGLPPGLIGWWPGDGNGTDIVGGRTATFRGGATNGLGFVGEAFVLNGNTAFMEVADASALNFGTNDFTVMLWVNFDSTSGEQVLIEKYIETYTPAAPGWCLSKLADDSLIFGTHGLQLVHTAPLAMTTNTWMHVVARRGSGTGAILVNGVLADTGAFPYAVDSTASLKFGHRGNPTDTPGSVDTRGFFLNGRIDEVAIFGRALSDGEVAAIHAAGADGMCAAGWRFVSVEITNEVFVAELAGWPRQATLEIEWSTNLTHWQWIETHAVTNGTLWFTHPANINWPVRFYRAVVR